MSLSKVKNIIAVSSCKGGVGKSTLAAYLAVELTRKNLKVGLVDTDLYGPSVPTLFNCLQAKVKTNEKKELIPVECQSVKLMSFGFLLGDEPAVMRGPIVSRYISQILQNTDWGELDYLLIDMPPGTGDVQLTITQNLRLTGAIIVTTPQTLSLVDVSRGILMFEKVNVPVLGIIENMAYFICDQCDKRHELFGKGGEETLKERFGLKTLASIPLLPQLGINNGEFLSNDFTTSAAEQTLSALKEINRVDEHTPEISFDEKEVMLKWNNDEVWIVSNRDLRLSCRCALCANELTGELLFTEKDIRPNIAAKTVKPLGNYALSINWNDGHASGIYPYVNIKRLLKVKN